MAKKLLEEATVRRFMKIAGLQPLSENFLQKEVYDPKSDPLSDENMGGADAVFDKGDGLGPRKVGPKGEDLGPDKPKQEQKYMEAEDEMEVEDDMEAPEAGEEEIELQGDEGSVSPQVMSAVEALLGALNIPFEKEGEEADEMEAPEAEDEMAPEDEEAVMEEGEHMEETPVDPAGHSLDKMQPMTGSKHAAKDADMSAMPKGKQEHMAESKEDFKARLVEEVTKRVIKRIKSVK